MKWTVSDPIQKLYKLYWLVVADRPMVYMVVLLCFDVVKFFFCHSKTARFA